MAGPWLGRKEVDAAAASAVKLRVAMALIKLDRRPEARQSFEALLASNPTPPIAALAHYYRGVLLASESPGKPPAIEALRAAIAGQLPVEQKVEALTLIARQHRLAGRNGDAIKTYEELRALRSPDKLEPATAAWVGRGLHEAGQFETSLAWLQPAASRKDAPEVARAEATYYLAESLRRLGRHDAAVEAYRSLLGSTRLFAEQARLGLAQTLLATGKPQEALKEYDVLIAAESSEVAAMALVQSGLMRLDQSHAAVATDKSAATALRHEARKRLNRAALLYDVPQLDYTIGQALVMLALMSSEEGDKDLARQKLQTLLSKNPKSVWNDAAQAEQALLDGNIGGAVALLRKINKESVDGRVRIFVQQRLRQLGEQP